MTKKGPFPRKVRKQPDTKPGFIAPLDPPQVGDLRRSTEHETAIKPSNDRLKPPHR